MLVAQNLSSNKIIAIVGMLDVDINSLVKWLILYWREHFFVDLTSPAK